jgi:hypothetical protein
MDKKTECLLRRFIFDCLLNLRKHWIKLFFVEELVDLPVIDEIGNLLGDFAGVLDSVNNLSLLDCYLLVYCDNLLVLYDLLWGELCCKLKESAPSS